MSGFVRHVGYSPATLHTIAADTQPTSSMSDLQHWLFSPSGLLLLVLGAGLLVTSLMGNNQVNSGSTEANAKARAKWAGKREIAAARKLAIQQLNGRSRKSACVWIIRPKTLLYPDGVCKTIKQKGGMTRKLSPELGAIPKETPVKMSGEKHRFYSKFENKRVSAETIWVPDTQRSTMVVGAPGSGKTFGAIDPMIRSVIEQGYPLILYDFKMPTQTSTIAYYAQLQGYKIHVFAPGFPESDVLNLMDFLTGNPEDDASLARQLATTMNKNFSLGKAGGGDQFFEQAGDQLVQAVMMLAKQMPHADMITVQTILEAPELSTRLMESEKIDTWIKKAFAQFLSVAGSEKTAASIIGTATLNFTRLMMARILACIVGKTTLPLDLDGKMMIVFGLDREVRDVVAPIVATAITMIVNRNLFRKGGRKDPLFCVFDELPTIYLDRLVNWENESRSDGFNGIIGYQNKSQLEKIYGKEMALAIMGGCATKFIFNPGEVESAEYFSKFFGDEEIARKNRSRSVGSGKPSTSHSVEVSTRKLVSPEEFICLPPGTCYMTNPAYANEKMSYLPRRIKVNLPPEELELAGYIETNWDKVRENLLARAAQFQRVPTEEDVLQRTREFDALFPNPQDEEDDAPSALDVLADVF